MNILYFSWIREKVGVPHQDVTLPDGVRTVGQLMTWLMENDDHCAAALAEQKAVRVAVNQEHVGFDHVLNDSDEVAFFPPVTGG